jgi:hypothetical protein
MTTIKLSPKKETAKGVVMRLFRGGLPNPITVLQ